MKSVALSAPQAAEFINVSERQFHHLRKAEGFPQPRAVGGRLRWLTSELDAYLRALPPVPVAPEPPQLARSTKRRQSIAPTPEAWPVAGSVTTAGLAAE